MPREGFVVVPVVVLGLVSLGCMGCAEGRSRAPGAADAGTRLDSGPNPADGGLPADAGAAVDAGRAVDAGSSVDSGSSVDAGGAVDAGPEPPLCSSSEECDDGLACNGVETCDPAAGCRAGTAVACNDSLACTADTCTEPSGACVFTGVDADSDGVVALGCGSGSDCNDADPSIHPGASEVCDGIDNDCSGAPDDGGGLECALGSGVSSCTTACGTTGTRPCGSDCRFGTCAAATETCGNACDDDQDGTVDEGCAPPPPPNDLCAGAIPLGGTSGTRTTDTLVSATAQATGCGTGVDVFYRVVLTSRSLVYLDTFGTGWDTRISYRGTSCPGTSVVCVDDSCSGLQTQLGRVLAAGTHYFAVHTYASTTTPGPLSLRWDISAAAAGDNQQIATGGTFAGATSGVSGVGASCGSSAGSPEDAFWWLQCPSDSRSIVATTCAAATNYDTVLHLWRGASAVSCNDDDSACAFSTLRSRLTATTTGAGPFVLFVDGWSTGSVGNYSVAISGF